MENTLLASAYLISADKSLLDTEAIHDYLSNESYWAKDRSLACILTSIENSLCFGVYLQQQQVGFARVVTDLATFAYLADVYILPGHRGIGLSKKLLAFIQDQPGLKSIRRFMLATKDAHRLYEQFGFKLISKPERWMEIFNE